MTTQTLEKRKARQKFIAERGIKFLNDIEPDRWPQSHYKTFEHIRTLGSVRFDSWVEDISVDWQTSPWKHDTRKRAIDMVQRARRCRDDDVIERVWRSKLEPFIFQRLDNDISCRHCRARLWRSEIEAVVDGGEEFAASLSRAQECRAVCQCPWFGPEGRDADVSKLFDFREESQVLLDKTAQDRINQSFEKPDKVYALRKVGTLSRLLRLKDVRQSRADHNTLEDTLSPSLVPNETNPIVFPFLLGESKSASSTGSFQGINNQCALMVEKMLRIQDRLHAAVGSKSNWVAGPLAWCFLHKGPLWRVSAAYISEGKKEVKIEIAKLWEGDITHNDGSIQLLLMVDYVADWARSVYREALIRELQKLAPLPLDDMSDLLSTVSTVRSYRPPRGGSRHPQTPTTQSALHNNNLNSPALQGRLQRIADWEFLQKTPDPGLALKTDPFLMYDSLYGVIRDSNFIRSRVVGIYITDSTFDDLVKCRPKKTQVEHLLRKIRKRFESETPIVVDQSTLCDIEALWSGNRRDFRANDNPNDLFQVILTVSAYVETDWTLTRELCYLAITESAKRRLHFYLSSPQKKAKGYILDWDKVEVPVIPPTEVAKILEVFLEASTTATLAACLYRCSLQPRFEYPDDADTVTLEKDDDTIYFHVMDQSPQTCSREVAWSLYLLHRVGRNESSVSFLRTSQRIDHIAASKTRQPSPNPWTTFGIASTEKAIAAYSNNRTRESIPEEAKCCIYVIDRLEVGRVVENLEKGDIIFKYCFVTQRRNRKKIAWNSTRDIDEKSRLEKVRRLVFHLMGLLEEVDESEEDIDEDETGSFFTELSESTDTTELDDGSAASSNDE